MKQGDKVILKRRPGHDYWHRGSTYYFYDGMEGEFIGIDDEGDYVCYIPNPNDEIKRKYFAEDEVHPIKIENSISPKPKTKINFNY